MSQGAAGGHRWRAHAGGPVSQRISLRVQRVLWTGLIILLAGVIGWLVLEPRLTAVKATYVVAIGMTYNDPVFRPSPFAQQSANAFDELHDRDKVQFPSPAYKHENQLEGARLLNWGLPERGELKDQNLLVYLNLQGVVVETSPGDKPGTEACFLTVGALPSSGFGPSDDQRVTARELLTKLGKLSEGEAANVVALLEVGDCGPNWRAGVLNRDFIAQLQEDAKSVCEEFPKLRVIGAVSPGESATSSITHGAKEGRTTFAHFVVQGLRGDANGWVFDPVTGQSSLLPKKNRRVSLEELYAYLNEHVATWSVKHRGQSQTVWRVPAGGDRGRTDSQLELVQIRTDFQLKKLAEVTKPSASKSKTGESTEKDAGSKAGQPASETPETGAKSKAKSAADPPDSSDKKSPRNESATEGKEKANGKSDASKSDDTEATKDAEKTPQKPTPAEDAQRQRLALRTRLFELWRRRDQWRSDESALAAWLTPREWRAVQLQLVHAEQCWRAGHDPKRIGDELLKVEETFREIESQRGDVETLRVRLLNEQLSVANETKFVRFGSLPSAASQVPLSAAEQEKSTERLKAFPKLLEEVFSADAEQPVATPQSDPKTVSPKTGVAEISKPTTSRAPQQEELRTLIRDHPELRARVWQRALELALAGARQAKAADNSAVKVFAKLHELVDAASLIAGASSIPSELIAVSEISDTARAALNGEFEWSAGLSRACGESLELRVQWEQIASENWSFQRWLREPLEDIDLKLVAAQRWLRAGQSAMAMSWLEDARSALAKLDSEAKTLQQAVKLRATLCAELPDFARWVARRLESNGSERSIPKTRLRKFAESRSEENFRGLVSGISDSDKKLFALFELIERTLELHTLLSIGERDIGARGLEPAVASRADFAKLAEQLGELKTLWDPFHAVFRDEVKQQIDEQAVTGVLWNRIDELLLVPWVSADQRQQLVGQLERLDRQLGVVELGIQERSSSLGAAQTRGEWQAFWAIITLRLAGLTPAAEKQLWDEFANSLRVPDLDHPPPEFLSSAKLGSAIGQKFGAIATAADAEPKELLVRGADSGDLPAAAVRGWFAKSLKQEVEQAFENRAAQVWKFAKLDDNGSTPRLSSLAKRWSNLVRKPSTPPPDWAPLTLQGITGRELWWSKGETRELALPLVLSHRSGGKRAAGLLRILDEGQAVEVRQGDETVPPSAEGISLKAGSDPQPIPLRLIKRPGTTTQDSVTMAVLDAKTKFPWDIRRLTLRVPSKAQDWRIEFRLKEELSQLSSAAINDRNSITSGLERYRTELLLPTASREQPLTLQPVLVVVNDTKVPSVTITVFERDENGRPKSKPLTELKDVKLNSIGAAIPLKFPPPTPLPAVAPTTTTTAPVAGPPARDVSRGWIFQITTDTNETFQQQVLPRVRPPETYFKPSKSDEFRVTFRDLELNARLRRETETDKPLLPDKVKVELVLPPELRKRSPKTAELIADVGRNGEGEFRAQFDERDREWLNEGQTKFTIHFKVAGWPRAFPWEIQHDREATLETNLRPTIVSPVRGKVIRQGEPLPVEIQVDSDLLNREGFDDAWTLRGELINDETKKVVRSESQTIVRSRQEKIELVGPDEEGQWQFAAAVADHRLTFPTDGLKGRYRVEVEATPNKANTSPPGAGRSNSVLVAIAPPDHTPPKPQPTRGQTISSIRAGIKKDWGVLVDAVDTEAGIAELAIGFDTDGDGLLSEKEFVFKTEPWTNPLEPAERKAIPLIIPFGKLPTKPGSHPVLVTARNGVNNLCLRPLTIDLTVEPPRGTVTVQVGNLGVKRYSLVRRLAGGKNGVEVQVVTGNQGQVSMELPVGDYEFLLERKSTGGAGPPEKVTVTENEESVITLDPSLVP